jgi:hypothetical protein
MGAKRQTNDEQEATAGQARNGAIAIHDLQFAMSALQQDVTEIKSDVKSLQGINEWRTAQDRRICDIEGQQKSYGWWLVGALFAGILALLGMVVQLLRNK